MEANIWMIDDQILFQICKFQVHDPDMLVGSHVRSRKKSWNWTTSQLRCWWWCSFPTKLSMVCGNKCARQNSFADWATRLQFSSAMPARALSELPAARREIHVLRSFVHYESINQIGQPDWATCLQGSWLIYGISFCLGVKPNGSTMGHKMRCHHVQPSTGAGLNFGTGDAWDSGSLELSGTKFTWL